jgi:hypothetical protein
MGSDEAALVRLWREKRGEAEPEDLSGNLIVQLGLVTEALNRHWYERNTGQTVECVQHRLRHPVLRWMGATLDGIVAGSGAVFEAKFMLPWSFSEEAAAEKHMAQLQHNMWVTNARVAALSVITGGGKWVEIKISGDPLYQHLLLTAEKKFWRCVENGEPPRPLGVEPPRHRIPEQIHAAHHQRRNIRIHRIVKRRHEDAGGLAGLHRGVGHGNPVISAGGRHHARGRHVAGQQVGHGAARLERSGVLHQLQLERELHRGHAEIRGVCLRYGRPANIGSNDLVVVFDGGAGDGVMHAM